MKFESFVPVYEDVNLLDCSNETLKDFGRQLVKHKALVFRNQNLTDVDCSNILAQFGPLRRTESGKYFRHPTNEHIFLVGTSFDGMPEAKEDDTKYLFAYGSLGWHCNGVQRPFEKNETAVALYCEKPGHDPVNGESILNISDTEQAYLDLPDDIKEIVDDTVWQPGFDETLFFWSDIVKQKRQLILEMYRSYDKIGPKPLRLVHPWTNKPSIYWSPFECVDMYRKSGKPLDKEWLRKFLFDHLFQEKYVYCHRYRKGDLVLMDQFNTLHERNHTTGPRLLYRLVFGYNYLVENQ